MGMTEQKDYYLRLRQIAEDIDEPTYARINAWAEWGKMSRNCYDAAVALSAIQELNTIRNIKLRNG